jgi:hypothetical protein
MKKIEEESKRIIKIPRKLFNVTQARKRRYEKWIWCLEIEPYTQVTREYELTPYCSQVREYCIRPSVWTKTPTKKPIISKNRAKLNLRKSSSSSQSNTSKSRGGNSSSSSSSDELISTKFLPKKSKKMKKKVI